MSPGERTSVAAPDAVPRPRAAVETSLPQRVSGPDIGLVHDYITQRGGAERVVLAMMDCLGIGTVRTSVFNQAATFPAFQGFRVRTSGLQSVGAFRRDPRLAAGVLAPVFSRMDLREHEVVLCSTSGWAHAVQARRKVAYCYTPARWLYEPQDYYRTPTARLTARAGRPLQARLERWDRAAAEGVDRYVAISTTVADRIRRVYGIEAVIIPPPVSIAVDGAAAPPPLAVTGPFLLTISRARGYKNTAALVEAMRLLPDLQLVIVGDEAEPPAAPSPEQLGRRAPGEGTPRRGRRVTDRVLRAGRVSDDELRWLYRNCAAVMSASNEDFGLTPLEGNAYGKPTVTLRAGGFLDTVVEQKTGVFFDALDPLEIAGATDLALRHRWSGVDLAANVERFSLHNFRKRLGDQLADVATG